MQVPRRKVKVQVFRRTPWMKLQAMSRLGAEVVSAMHTVQFWHDAHSIPSFPVFVGVVALQDALCDMPALLDHEFVERVDQISR